MAGSITALALRAMAAELGTPDQSLRSVTTVFAAQVPPGPVDIDVTVLRRGRTMSQATATVRPVGADERAHRHGGLRRGAPRVRVHRRDASPTCRPPSSARRFAIRSPRGSPGSRPRRSGSGSSRGRPSATPRGTHGSRRRRSASTGTGSTIHPVNDDGEWDPLALVALCDTMPGAVGERMGPESAVVVRAQRRSHRAHPGPGVVAVVARPQPCPPCRRRLRVGRDGAVGPGARPRRLRHADDVLQLPRRPAAARAAATAGLTTY